MSQWCRSALCGHPLPALTDSWTHGAASRHTIAPISHTRPLPTGSRQLLLIYRPVEGRRLSFSACQALWRYFDGGVECKWDRKKSRFWTNIWLSNDYWWSANNKCDGGRCSLPHRRRRISEFLFITACSMHDHDEEKRTKQNLFTRSGKCEAEVTNNIRL